MSELTKMIGNNEVPIHIRNQLAGNIYLMFKSKQIIKFVLLEGETYGLLQHLYSVLVESSQRDGTSTPTLSELQVFCA